MRDRSCARKLISCSLSSSISALENRSLWTDATAAAVCIPLVCFAAPAERCEPLTAREAEPQAETGTVERLLVFTFMAMKRRVEEV